MSGVAVAPLPGTPMPLVVSAVPSSMSIPALGLTAPVGVMHESACPVLKPPTMNDAYWVGCRAKPGTDSDGTVFIIGHSWTGGRAVFNGLAEVKAGDAIELTTPSGRLTYRVEHTVNYAKFGEIQASHEVLDRVPGRLILVTCLLGPGNTTTDQNFVVQAQLVAAVQAG
jgi:LPXTG-site transpeptidase (sortase) family protein